MKPSPRKEPSTHWIDGKTSMVRFPLPCEGQDSSQKLLLRLGTLLPRRWRRRVVIQGQQFWLPS
jgi:hypothetical protein